MKSWNRFAFKKTGNAVRKLMLMSLFVILLCLCGCKGTDSVRDEENSFQGATVSNEEDGTGETGQQLPANAVIERKASVLPTGYVTDEMYSNAIKFAKPDCSRLAGVMRRAEAGEDILVAVIGGSITQGSSSTRQENSYASLMLKWWTTTFPNSRISFINAGIGGTDSYLGVHRVQKDVLDYNPDFVIVEYSVNDSNGTSAKNSYDNLVYRILTYKSNPAVMLLYMTMEDGTSAQATHTLVGFNYSLPQLSYHDAIVPELEAGKINWKDISPDNIHPNDIGHAMCGELIWRYLNDIYVNLDNYPEPVNAVNRQLTKNIYNNAHILDNESLEAEMDGFSTDCAAWSEFNRGWSTKDGGRISFTVNASRIGILYCRSVSGSYGKAEIYVDGEYVMTLDGDFHDGWGTFGTAEAVFASNVVGAHKVEIVVDTEDEKTGFDVYGIMISE